jgi:hypothetical protein
MSEIATVAQAIDDSDASRSGAGDGEAEKRTPLKPQTVLSLVAFAVAGAIVLACVAAAAR